MELRHLYKQGDREYKEYRLESVAREEQGWDLGLGNGGHFYCSDSSIEPCVGDVVRLYGKGLGYPVRGLDVRGHTVFYRTPAEQAERERREAERRNQEQRDQFESDRTRLDADYAALPPEFQKRINRLRRNNPDFRWRHEAYEMMCCRDAVRIATTLKTPDRVQRFQALRDWKTQQHWVPGLEKGHSGNTFGMAVYLAWSYLTSPELVDKLHGAICPVVGCERAGCYAVEPEELLQERLYD